MNHVGHDAGVGQVVGDTDYDRTEQREHDDLALRLLQDLQQHVEAWLAIELHHLAHVGVRRAGADLQQLVDHCCLVDCGDGLAAGAGQHLVFDQPVVFRLLRRQLDNARLLHHGRQVQAVLLGEADGRLQRSEHLVARVGLGRPLEHRDLVHHLVAPGTEEPRHVGRRHQLGQAVRIQWRLRGWRACHHPQAGVLCQDTLQRLPATRGGCLVGAGFIHDDQVEAPVAPHVLGHQRQAVVVHDDELIVTPHQFSTTACLGVVGHNRAAVHDAGRDVVHPCGVHDGHGAQHQHTTHLADAHEVVGRPERGHRLASAGLVEHERTLVQREERSRLDLVCHRAPAARPVVPRRDGRRYFLHAQVAQHPHLVQAPVHCHLVDARRHLVEHTALGDDAVLGGVSRAQHKRAVLNDLHLRP